MASGPRLLRAAAPRGQPPALTSLRSLRRRSLRGRGAAADLPGAAGPAGPGGSGSEGDQAAGVRGDNGGGEAEPAPRGGSARRARGRKSPRHRCLLLVSGLHASEILPRLTSALAF